MRIKDLTSGEPEGDFSVFGKDDVFLIANRSGFWIGGRLVAHIPKFDASEILSQGCTSQETGIFLWMGVENSGEQRRGSVHSALLRKFRPKPCLLCTVLNLKKARHFSNVSDLNCLGFRQRWVNDSPVCYASKVVRQPNSMVRGALATYAEWRGSISMPTCLCGVFIGYRVGDCRAVACRERLYHAVQTFNFDSSWPRIGRLPWQFSERFRWCDVLITHSL